MNKYKKLLSNTFIFAVGTFSSKVLVFLLMPLYTTALTTEQFGVADLIVQTGNFLLPLASLGIVNAIIRFGLDKSVNKKDVFSIGILSIATGLIVMLLLTPLLNLVPVIKSHTLLIYAFVAMSSFRALCSQFTRARGMVRLYAFDGILSTFNTILFNVLFLVVFKLGVIGYISAIICADFISTLFLFITGNLKKYIKFQFLSKNTAREMIKYSLPLIPNTLCWWITNVSDRFLIVYMLGEAFNGLYSVASRLPTTIMLVSTIFMDAWQMSAITENKNRSGFFTKVFKSYSALIFMAGSGIILLAKPLIKLLASTAFYDAWRYIPFLVLATVFNCFGMFCGTVYTVNKKSISAFLTVAVGALTNIVLNIILIPTVGVNGAAAATFISYFIVFILRVLSAKKYINMRFSVFKLILNTALLLAQSIIIIMELKYWIILEILLFVFMLLINFKDLRATVIKVFKRS